MFAGMCTAPIAARDGSTGRGHEPAGNGHNGRGTGDCTDHEFNGRGRGHGHSQSDACDTTEPPENSVGGSNEGSTNGGPSIDVPPPNDSFTGDSSGPGPSIIVDAIDQPTPRTVPEPTSTTLIAGGLIAVFVRAWRAHRSRRNPDRH